MRDRTPGGHSKALAHKRGKKKGRDWRGQSPRSTPEKGSNRAVTMIVRGTRLIGEKKTEGDRPGMTEFKAAEDVRAERGQGEKTTNRGDDQLGGA